jgi:flagellar motor switch protein FliM
VTITPPNADTPGEDEEDLMAEWDAMASDGDDGSDEADSMASEWEAMLGGDDDDDMGSMGGGRESTRVLNQDEIDSLLGFDEASDESMDRAGIQAILNSALVSYERLPMLEVVFDRLVRQMSTSLRNFTSDNVEVSLDDILSQRFGDYLNSIPLPAMINIFKAEEWDDNGLLVVDSSMIYSIVDVLLGGRRGTAAMRVEGRPYTVIEQSLVESLVHVVLADLSASFDPLSPVTFRFDRLEVNPRFATISIPSNACIVARLRIDMEDRGGRLEILIPFSTLEPIRELLLQGFMGEKFGRDSIWESHLSEEMWLTQVDLEAVLETQDLTLNRVLNLEVGSQLMLQAKPGSQILLRCGDQPMFSGRMGRKGNKIAIRLDHKERKKKR